MTLVDYTIIGGGIGGLCAAARLLELGFSPLVIEAGQYPAHKVCGEFISPPMIAQLNRWGITPLPINTVSWSAGKKTLSFALPFPAGSLSHLTLDLQLAQLISRGGATLLTSTKVIGLTPPDREGQRHSLTLSSGEEIQSKHLLIATGRLPGYPSKKQQIRYIGLKAHFTGIDLNSALHMFSFEGAYLGLVPVENGWSNLACLMEIEKYRQFSSANEAMQSLVSSQHELKSLLSCASPLFDEWMEAAVPEFGWRSPPQWPHTYWIADAAGTIPPASGNGLSLAIASGCLAAEYAVNNQPLHFKKAWKRKCGLQMRLAKKLHQLFLSPSWGSRAAALSGYFPLIAQKVFALTRL
ncbi:MAG: NAD(P)/FAD-dependent oxidoreductase [Parachlamydiaceae bacterium]